VPPADVTGRRASRLPLILAVIGALVVVVAIVTLLRDDGDGTGTFAGEVTEEDGHHGVAVDGGSVLVVEVEPSSDLDAVVEIDPDREDRPRVIELYEDTAAGDQLLRRDVGFEGDRERIFLAVPFDVDVTVEVSGFEGSEGEYEIDIDAIPLDAELDEDADGEELLEAVAATEDVPGQVRSDAEALVADG
jgi:hypothetical protein